MAKKQMRRQPGNILRFEGKYYQLRKMELEVKEPGPCDICSFADACASLDSSRLSAKLCRQADNADPEVGDDVYLAEGMYKAYLYIEVDSLYAALKEADDE